MPESGRIVACSFFLRSVPVLRRHHNRPLASYRADFLPCRGNREIERKERRREREREGKRGGRGVAQSTRKGTNVESGEKREILNESECLTGGGKDRSTCGVGKVRRARTKSSGEKEGSYQRGGGVGRATLLSVPFHSADAMFRIVDDSG